MRHTDGVPVIELAARIRLKSGAPLGRASGVGRVRSVRGRISEATVGGGHGALLTSGRAPGVGLVEDPLGRLQVAGMAQHGPDGNLSGLVALIGECGEGESMVSRPRPELRLRAALPDGAIRRLTR